MAKRLLSVLVALAFLVPLQTFALSFNYGGLSFSETAEGEVGVMGLNLPDLPSDDGYDDTYPTAVTIPYTVTFNKKSYTVTSVAKEAFKDCTFIKSFTIADGKTPLKLYGNPHINSIGIETLYIGRDITSDKNQNTCFRNMTKLKTLTFGNMVTKIEKFLFFQNKTIENISLGNSITEIGERAFEECEALKSVVLPESLTSMGTSAFGKCKSLSTFIFNSNLKIIPQYLLSYCSSLSEITVPNTIEEIGFSAFFGCESLEKIIIEDGDTPILFAASGSPCYGTNTKSLYLGRNLAEKSSTLMGSELEEVVIGDKVTVLPKTMFLQCKKLETVHFGNSLTEIGERAFEECISLKSVDLPESLTVLGMRTFGTCKSLESFNFPSNLKIIPQYLLCYCSSLSEITIPNTIDEIGFSAFFGCESLEKIIIEDGDTPILFPASSSPCYGTNTKSLYLGRNLAEKSSTFASTELKDVVIGDKVTILPKSMFSQCKELETINLGNSLTEIGERAFEECVSLKSVILPESLTTFGKSTFAKCQSLDYINFPRNLKVIPDNLLSYCKSIKEVVIPENIEKVETQVFWGCESLTKITIEDSENPIEISSEIGYLFNLEHLYLGRDVSGKTARFESKETLTAVEIGPEVKNLKKSLFSECPLVRDIRVYAEVPPVCEDKSVWADNVYNEATLSVPRGTKKAYREAPVWKLFMKMQSNERYTASITFNADGGEVLLNGASESPVVVDCDDPLKFTVSPKPGYKVADATLSGEDVTARFADGNKVLAFDEIFGDMNLAVEFAEITYTVRASIVAGEGIVTLNGKTESGVTVREGETVTIGFEPASGFELASVSLNGKDITGELTDNGYVIENILRDYELAVNFKEVVIPDFVTVTLLGLPGGEVAWLMPYGSCLNLTVTPDDEWEFHSLTFNGEKHTQLDGGIFISPELVEDATVSIVFIDKSGINSAFADNGITVTARGMTINAEGMTESDTLEVYNTSGTLLHSGKDSSVTMDTPGIYIARVGGRSFKVALR